MWKVQRYRIPELSRVKYSKEESKSQSRLAFLGELEYYLKVFFKQIGNTMLRWQSAFSRYILKQFGMKMAETASTAVVEIISEWFLEVVLREPEHKEDEAFPYRSWSGCLFCMSNQYLRELTFSVAVICRNVESPTTALWVDMKLMLPYLQVTRETSIMIDAVTSGTTMKRALLQGCQTISAGTRFEISQPQWLQRTIRFH